MAIVYQHRRLDTLDVFYVGIGKDKRRAYSKKARNPHWHNVVEKLGYIVEILYKGVSWEAACEIEKKYIKHYGRKDLGLGPLVNMTDGGDGSLGLIPNEETREKLSKAKKDIPLSKEHKQKIGNANKGKNPNKNHSEEWIKQHSERMKGNNNPNYQKSPSKKVLSMISGENCTTSKLKTEDVIWIRKNYINKDINFGSKPIAKKFNISQRQVIAIIKRERWKHI